MYQFASAMCLPFCSWMATLISKTPDSGAALFWKYLVIPKTQYIYVCKNFSLYIIGILFLSANLILDGYLALLHDEINPIITQVVENFMDFLEDQIICEENLSTERLLYSLQETCKRWFWLELFISIHRKAVIIFAMAFPFWRSET